MIKLIHISTDEVYGDIKKSERSNENYKYEPSSLIRPQKLVQTIL